MLPFPSKPLWLAICRDQVGGTLAGRGRSLAPEVIAFAPQTGARNMAAALTALDAWIAQHGRGARRVDAVVSDSFVRYALLPWNDAPLSKAEDRILQQAKFEELYGDMGEWQVLAERQHFGQARIACAMPAALVDGVAALCRAHGVKPGAIVPHFIACWNRWRRRIGAASGILAVVERDNVVIASFARGGWSGLRSLFVVATAQAVADIVFREKLLLGLDEAVPVWIAGAAGGIADTHAGQQQRQALLREPSVAMAMAGAGR